MASTLTRKERAAKSTEFMRAAEDIVYVAYCGTAPKFWDAAHLMTSEFTQLADDSQFAMAAPSDVRREFRCKLLGDRVGGKLGSVLRTVRRATFFDVRKAMMLNMTWEARQRGSMSQTAPYFICDNLMFNRDGDWRDWVRQIVMWNDDSLPVIVSDSVRLLNERKVAKWMSSGSDLENSLSRFGGRFLHGRPLLSGYGDVSTGVLPFVLGFEFSRHFNWSVGFRVNGGPQLILDCSPVTVRDLLCLRDVPEGKKRRDALLHVVSRHCRRPAADELAEATIEVREHLRGSRTAEFGELQFEVRESEEDRERIELAKERTNALRQLPKTKSRSAGNPNT